MAKQGSLSINSENIFPIIKKWLYSDHDIFIRELVSNGCDAVTKLKKLSVMGEFEEADDEKYKVEVRINPTVLWQPASYPAPGQSAEYFSTGTEYQIRFWQTALLWLLRRG